VTREDVLTYLDHFNNRRYEAFAAYYHPEVEVDYSYTRVRGPQGIIDFYRDFHQDFSEHLDVGVLLVDDKHVCGEYITTFTCLRPSSKLVSAGPMKAGEVIVSTNFCLYDLRDGKFANIRIGRYRSERRPAA
jgi:hypothetical protein